MIKLDQNQGRYEGEKKQYLWKFNCSLWRLRITRGIIPIKSIRWKGRPSDLAQVWDHLHLTVLTFKPMLQRIPIALAQVKAGNASEKLLNEIIQVIYSLYRTKEITKKKYITI